MKLRYSPTSPYVRKVTVTAIETGLNNRIERILTIPASAPDLPGDNPLGKVPALILDNGQSLFDSPVIVEYLGQPASGSEGRSALGRGTVEGAQAASTCRWDSGCGGVPPDGDATAGE
jgi:glutathione S-transferase